MNLQAVRSKKLKALKHKNRIKRLKMSGTTVMSPYPPTLSSLIHNYRCNDLSSHLNHINIHSYGYDVTDNKTSDLYNKQAFFIMNDHFHREEERLKTFEKWPLDWLDKKQLAQTGMFFTGEEDKVKCYFCEVEIGRWEREDQPVPEHLRWSPNCPLLRRRTTNNVPINPEELNHLLPAISYDVCGTHDAFEARPNVYAEYPEYAIEASRERSFTDWPRHMKQTPAQMAEAGFFHSGHGDRVKCFSCGGGLKDWDPTDDPWEQHALWLPKCRFLKLMKGQSFIDTVIAKKKTVPACEDDNEKPNCSTQVPTTAATVSEGETTTSSAPISSSQALSTTKSNQNPTTCTEEALSSTHTSKATPLPSVIMCDVNSTCSESEKRAQTSSSSIPEEKLCKICYTNEYNTAFLPCGHVVACTKCASSVTKCPMCRKHFTDIMRVYFS